MLLDRRLGPTYSVSNMTYLGGIWKLNGIEKSQKVYRSLALFQLLGIVCFETILRREHFLYNQYLR